ncbi:unnamed protein product, partial [Thlaspi arvense]
IHTQERTNMGKQIPLMLCLFLFIFSISSSLQETEARKHSIKPAPITRLVSRSLYDSIFIHKENNACPAKGFYTYEAFVEATRRFPRFGSVGTSTTRRREVAAFLAQISHETTGGWATAPDGPYAWGLCFKEEVSPQSNYCDASNKDWPCVLGKNYNYGQAGRALDFDGLGNPDIVANNSVLAFKTALWFWMTEQAPKPSCHDVMTSRYRPTRADKAANRTVGFGLTTNIINGGLECGIPGDGRVNDRVGYFQRYAQLFNVNTGPYLDCENQRPFS